MTFIIDLLIIFGTQRVKMMQNVFIIITLFAVKFKVACVHNVVKLLIIALFKQVNYIQIKVFISKYKL